MSNFRPVIHLPLIWKLLTRILTGELYKHLEKVDLLPWKQKRCRKGSLGTKDRLLIDRMTVRDGKRRLTLLAVAWINNRKVYGMAAHNW